MRRCRPGFSKCNRKGAKAGLDALSEASFGGDRAWLPEMRRSTLMPGEGASDKEDAEPRGQTAKEARARRKRGSGAVRARRVCECKAAELGAQTGTSPPRVWLGPE